MNLQHERIAALCAQLKLDRIAAEWPALAQDAARDEASFADFLERLLIGRERRAQRAAAPDAAQARHVAGGQDAGAVRLRASPAARRGRRSRSSPADASSSAPRTSCCSARAASARPTSRMALAYRAVMAGIKTRFITAADLMLQLAAAKHRAG